MTAALPMIGVAAAPKHRHLAHAGDNIALSADEIDDGDEDADGDDDPAQRGRLNAPRQLAAQRSAK